MARIRVRAGPLLLPALGALLLVPAARAGVDYYVQRGTGCTSAHPTCGTEASPFDDIDQCAAIAAPGDSCWVMNGTYTKGIDSSAGRPYQPAQNGTAAEPIAFRAYPGHRPLVQGAIGVTWTFGLGERRDYIIYSGFDVVGVMRVRGDSETSRSRGIVIERFRITGGGGKDDGNWSAIFVEWAEDLIIRDSLIGAVSAPSGSGQKGVSIFNGRRTLVEHNTIHDNPSEGVFDKEGGEDNVYRRNVFENNGVALKINNQSDENGIENERTLIYENIFLCDDPSADEAVRMLSQPTDWQIYNNTGYQCDAIVVRSSSGPADGGIVYNNVWWASQAGTTMWESQYGDDREPDLLDYNLYAPGGKYRENRYTSQAKSYDSLAEWSLAAHPRIYDTNSLEGDPGFVDLAGGDFHLQANSPARGRGRFGEDLGAYPRDDGTVIGPRAPVIPVTVPALPRWATALLAVAIAGLPLLQRRSGTVSRE